MTSEAARYGSQTSRALTSSASIVGIDTPSRHAVARRRTRQSETLYVSPAICTQEKKNSNIQSALPAALPAGLNLTRTVAKFELTPGVLKAIRTRIPFTRGLNWKTLSSQARVSGFETRRNARGIGSNPPLTWLMSAGQHAPCAHAAAKSSGRSAELLSTVTFSLLLEVRHPWYDNILISSLG